MAKISKEQERIEKIYDALENLLIPIDKANFNVDTYRKSFRSLAKKYHPDVCKLPDAKELFEVIQKSQDLLIDEDEFILKNVDNILAYEKFIKEEEIKDNKDDMYSKENRKKLLEGISSMKVEGAKNIENKIRQYLKVQQDFLNYDIKKWRIYLPILEEKLLEKTNKIEDDIAFLNRKIRSASSLEQKDLTSLKEAKTNAKNIMLKTVKKQIEIKNAEFKEKSERLMTLLSLCENFNQNNPDVFLNFKNFYENLEKEYEYLLKKETNNNKEYDVVSKLDDIKLGISR